MTSPRGPRHSLPAATPTSAARPYNRRGIDPAIVVSAALDRPQPRPPRLMRLVPLRLRRLAGHVAVAAFSMSTAATAQPGPYRLTQLAPGVHLMERENSPGGASDSNVLII